MIIDCGKRRLVSDRWGWKIEIRHINQKTGATEWREDRPAYPSSLAQALEALCERILTDGPDLTITQLPDALKTAAREVRHYMELARAAA
jgi:hypothetical protein